MDTMMCMSCMSVYVYPPTREKSVFFIYPIGGQTYTDIHDIHISPANVTQRSPR